LDEDNEEHANEKITKSSIGKPMPGFSMLILNDEGEETGPIFLVPFSHTY